MTEADWRFESLLLPAKARSIPMPGGAFAIAAVY
jgi:hypothetical protein